MVVTSIEEEAWRKACRPKAQGALGIINLRAHNNPLLLKFLHKFYNHRDLPWVHLTWQELYRRQIPPHLCKPKGSFWWKDIIRMADNFFHDCIMLYQKWHYLIFLE